jgi:hypothetical protein
MKYHLSDDNIRWHRNVHRRIILRNLLFAGIIAAGMFLQQGRQSPHLTTIAAIVGLQSLFFAGITFFQIRAARSKLESTQLDEVFFECEEHGLTIDDTAVKQTIKYNLISSVTLFRLRNGPALRALLKTRNGKELWIHVACIEAFVTELRSRLGAVPYKEKRMWY